MRARDENATQPLLLRYSTTTPPPQDYHWLPDMDSNHDWVSQSHLCYHYTIGQNLSGKLAASEEKVG